MHHGNMTKTKNKRVSVKPSQRSIRAAGIMVPIYNIWLQVYIGGTAKDAIEQIGKDYPGGEPTLEDAWGFTYRLKGETDKDGVSVLWWNGESVNYLVHELFHLTKQIMDRAGVTLTNESEEAWAYLFGFLYESVTTIPAQRPVAKRKNTK